VNRITTKFTITAPRQIEKLPLLPKLITTVYPTTVAIAF